MPIPVQLQAVVDQMDFGDDDWRAFINGKTGELMAFPGDLRRALEDDEGAAGLQDWEAEQLEDYKRVVDDEDFISLPSKFDIHEYAIMERFCLSLDKEQMSDRLLDAIRGRGAFRRFKDEAHRLGIREDWYRYRNDALKRIAADFLEANAIPYLDDGQDGRAPATEAG